MIGSRRLAWSLALLALAAAIYGTIRHKRDLVDFDVFRKAGVRARVAEPLYRPEDGHYQFKYLPAFALAMTPLAALDPEVGKVAWFTASAVLLTLFVVASVEALPDRRLSRRLVTWLTVLFMGKFYIHELALGQSNIMLGTVLLAALVAATRGRRLTAAALVGLAVFIKPYAIILVPWLAVVEGPAAVAVFAAVACVGLVAPAVVYGWQGNLDLLAGWYRTVTDTSAPNLLVPENISLGTMWAKWIGVGRPAATMALATAIALCAVAAWVVFMRRRVRSPRYLEFGVLMLLVPLISPQGWDYLLLLATPAVACIVDRWRELSPPWRWMAGVMIALMSFTIFDVLGRALYGRLMAVSIVTVAACGLVVVAARVRAQALA